MASQRVGCGPLAQPHPWPPWTVPWLSALAAPLSCLQAVGGPPPCGWMSLVDVSLLAFVIFELPAGAHEPSGLGTTALPWWYASWFLGFPGLYNCLRSYASQKLFSLAAWESPEVCMWGLSDPTSAILQGRRCACLTQRAAEAQGGVWSLTGHLTVSPLQRYQEPAFVSLFF